MAGSHTIERPVMTASPAGTQHTLLLRQGTWMLRGSYYGIRNTPLPVDGRIIIAHSIGKWTQDTYIRQMMGSGIETHTRRDIIPFPSGRDYTSWNSRDLELGVLIGKYTVVQDCLIAMFVSESGIYCGTEHFRRISETAYSAIGYIFAAQEKHSSWSLTLSLT